MAIWWIYTFFWLCWYSSSISSCVVLCTSPSWCHILAEMSCHILAGNSWIVYGDFGFKSLSVCCYLLALLGKFFPFGWNLLLLLLCIGRFAMVTQHESKVHSVWYLWMCLFVMESLSVLFCWYPYSYDWSKFALSRVMWALYIIGLYMWKIVSYSFEIVKVTHYILFTIWLELLI